MEQISETHGLPSSWDLAYAEARSLPTLYRRGAAEWPALSRWPGLEGAKYLSDLHGDNIVDVAISADTTFSGDVRHAMSVSVPFRAFLHGDIFCEESDVAGGEGALDRLSEGSNVTSSGNAQPMACYLAQCPIYNKSGHSRELPPEGEQHETTVPVGGSSSLHKLMRDVIVPQALGDCGSLCCVNLWMCGSAKGPLTSTLHYDGHNNILTCVSGCKKVLLFPPDHSECLAALQPVYATSCNHCRLRNEAFAAAWSGGLDALLHPGDCLFIPEGWFHQVTSEPNTMAVNLWWPGAGGLAVGVGEGLDTFCCFASCTSLRLHRRQHAHKHLVNTGDTTFAAEAERKMDEGTAEGAGRRRIYLARRLMEALALGERARARVRVSMAAANEPARAELGAPEYARESRTGDDAACASRACSRGTAEAGSKRRRCAASDRGESEVASESAVERDAGGKGMGSIEALLTLSASERNGALLSLGVEGVRDWLQRADDVAVEVVTSGWEAIDAGGSAADRRQQEELYSLLWGSADAAALRAELMQRKQRFARACFKEVVAALFARD